MKRSQHLFLFRDKLPHSSQFVFYNVFLFYSLIEVGFHCIFVFSAIFFFISFHSQLNPTLEATIRKEVEKILNAHIIFLDKYLEWISNIVPIRKNNGDIILCVDFCAFNRESVKDNFPLPNMELIMQQVVGYQLILLLDGFSRYYQIRVNRVDKYKNYFYYMLGHLCLKVYVFWIDQCRCYLIASYANKF
jgi:hypothetical protein